MTILALALFTIAQTPVPTRVACVGASIVAGVGTTDPAKTSFPAQLQRLLGPGYEVRNFGNSGKAVTKAHPWSYWNVPEFAAAKAFNADIVVISMGTNDAVPEYWPKVRDDFVDDLEDLVATFRKQKNHPKVFVGAPPPVHDDPRRQNFEEETLPLIRQAAREVHAPLIDFHNALASHPDWYNDQIHPNDEGAWSMALEAYFAIGDTRAMKKDWKVVSADSEQSDEGPAINAIDGDPGTYWHTQWSPKTDKYPHEIVIDFGKSLGVSGIRYTPRQDGGVNGRVKEFEVYISDDKATWGAVAATGTLPDRLAPTVYTFKAPATGRYLKFVAKSEAHGGPWTTVGELDVIPRR